MANYDGSATHKRSDQNVNPGAIPKCLLCDGPAKYELNRGTAFATRGNTVAVNKPGRLAQPAKVGQRLVYDGRRRSTGTAVDVGLGSMHALFDNRMEPNLIHFDVPQWMDYITFEK